MLLPLLKGSTFIQSKWRVLSRNYCITSQTIGGRVSIEGVPFYWEKYGTGPHVVLCIPGLVGSISDSFHPVWKLLDCKKYTLVGMDPPGHGHSYPPEVDFLSEELYSKRDARFANFLMRELGYEKYSVLGHSNGGTAALIMAGTFAKKIQKVICCNSPCRATENVLKFTQLMTNFKNWPSDLLKKRVDFYGETYLRKMLQNQVEFTIDDRQPGRDRYYGAILEAAKNIECPTLIIAGLKDISWNPMEVSNIGKSIKNFRLVKFPNHGHNHLDFLQDFVKVTEKFLDE